MHLCCERSPSGATANHSVFTRLPREPFCEARAHCGVCRLSTTKKGVHPVDIYRYWDDMDCVSDRAHREVPWDLVRPFLESHGYHLREKIPGSSADRAYRVHRAFDMDGNPVFIKSVPVVDITNEELRIMQLLSTDECAEDPRNHTIPIRDILYYHPDFSLHPRYKRAAIPADSRAFIIMDEMEPLPRNLVNDYVPATVGDCLEFARQCLEGLAFLHDIGIAHGDISQWNILMSDSCDETLRYFIIDFGLSRHIPKPWFSEPLHLPLKPQVTHQSPEWSTTVPFNPFAHDVFCMSKSWRFRIDRWDDHKHWQRVPGFLDLVDSMEHPDPWQRPSSEIALRILEAIMEHLPAELHALSFAERWNYRSFKRAPTPALSNASSSDDSDDNEEVDDVLPQSSFIPQPAKTISFNDESNLPTIHFGSH